MSERSEPRCVEGNERGRRVGRKKQKTCICIALILLTHGGIDILNINSLALASAICLWCVSGSGKPSHLCSEDIGGTT